MRPWGVEMGGIFKNITNPQKSILNPLNTPLGKLRGSVQKKIHAGLGFGNVPTPTEAARGIEDSIFK